MRLAVLWEIPNPVRHLLDTEHEKEPSIGWLSGSMPPALLWRFTRGATPDTYHPCHW